jgi:hypothetical protein
MVIHDLVALFIEFILKPVAHGMLGYGIFLRHMGWGCILVLPLSIGSGELWFKDAKRYIPHAFLLIALSIYSAGIGSIHPYRTVLFLACAYLTLPLRWLIDRTTVPQAVA